MPVWCGGMLRPASAGPRTPRSPRSRLHAAGRCVGIEPVLARDIVTEPAVLEDGHIRVPTGHGIGVQIDPVALEDFTVARETVRR